MPVHGQEDHSHAVLARRRQGNAQFGAFAVEKGVRNLNQDAGAVAGLRVAATRAAMHQILQNLDALGHNVVGLLALDIGYKANAAAVMLLLGAIETLRAWKTSKWICFLHVVWLP